MMFVFSTYHYYSITCSIIRTIVIYAPNVFFQDILRFWLDKGVDGFRVNSAKYLFEDYELRDQDLIQPRPPTCVDADVRISILIYYYKYKFVNLVQDL